MDICQLQKKNELYVIGLMSGTSRDGLDICAAKINRTPTDIKATILNFDSYQYDNQFQQYLQRVISSKTSTICQANYTIAQEWVSLIRRFIRNNDIRLEDVDLIGSHGQTIWHIHGKSTLQIGEGAVLSEAFTKPVIADFRANDVAAGGSGAPLVPFVDYLLFRNYARSFLLLNIGGIANFTLIPADSESSADVYALDSGPGNGLIDAAVKIATKGEEAFDQDGKWAQAGHIDEQILQQLKQHPYLQKKPPKSTGKEEFGSEYVKKIVKEYNIIEKQDFSNLIATLTRFTAETIYTAFEDNFASKFNLDEIVVSGGGAKNPVIMQHLRQLFRNVTFSNPSKYGLDIDAKEGLSFAILAALRVWHIPANVPNATGARKPVLLGKIINQGASALNSY